MSLVQGDFGNFSISIFFLVTEKCWSLKKIAQRNFFIFLNLRAVKFSCPQRNMCSFVRILDYPRSPPLRLCPFGKCTRVGFQ